jgi:periplasmic protein TonB
MFSTKEKRRPDKQTNPRRNRNPEAMVRLTHETLVGEISGEGTLSFDTTQELTVDQPWDDIVFENRNREYGAYVLRKGYSLNVMIGLGITILAVMFLIFYPALARMFGSNEVVAQGPPRKLVYSELSVPPPIDKPKPLPPQVRLPRLKKVVKFVPPKVVKEQVVELLPTVEEIRESDIGAVEVEGPADVVFEEPVEEVVADINEVFTVVDQQPEFAGGYEAMMAFIKQNMKYPANARRMQIEGTVHVSFVVSKNGSISDVKVLRGIMTECDREAVRVVEMMPAWKPGKQNGRNVNVRFILPLKFRIN